MVPSTRSRFLCLSSCQLCQNMPPLLQSQCLDRVKLLSLLDWTATFISTLPVSQHALELQLAVANVLQLLVHSERNQQVLCGSGLPSRLLQRCSCAMSDEEHPLHPPLQRTFERLASQNLQPMALRSGYYQGVPTNFLIKYSTELLAEGLGC